MWVERGRNIYTGEEVEKEDMWLERDSKIYIYSCRRSSR